MLPAYEGKTVLELGAGIGRFTGELAEKAGQILALDFIDSVIKKVCVLYLGEFNHLLFQFSTLRSLSHYLMLQNESINGHHKNAKFLCADVTSPDLKIEDESMDLIFSNWLLMYLSDKEVCVLL